jgi:ABC-type multidrug transport system permease subunit
VNTTYFDIVGRVGSDEELNTAIMDGRAQVGIKIPPDFTARLLDGEPATFQVLIDGSDSTVARQALNISNGIAMDRSLKIAASEVPQFSRAPVEARPRILFNPDMETARFMVPGLVGIIMQLVTVFLTAFSIVREKENGTLEQLMVTPISRLGLMLGKLAPYSIVGAFETAVVLLLMRYLFAVHITGSLPLLAVFSVPFLVTALGLGLLVSTIASSQVEAMQWAFLIMLPSILLSGFIFPQENMPLPIYYVGQLIPVTYFLRILRGIILRGAGFPELWDQALWLVLMAIIVLLISAFRFRKTLA